MGAVLGSQRRTPHVGGKDSTRAGDASIADQQDASIADQLQQQHKQHQQQQQQQLPAGIMEAKRDSVTTAAQEAAGDALAEDAKLHNNRRSPVWLGWLRYKGGLRLMRRSSPNRQVFPVEELDFWESIEVAADLGRPETAPASPDARAPKSGVDLEAGRDSSSSSMGSSKGLGFIGRLLLMYSDSLDKRPIVTKAISSGLIGLLGDVTAQGVEWGVGGAPFPWSGKHAVWRSCAVMIDGFFVNGPLLHFAYEILEKFMPAGESLWAALMQVCVDVFVIDPVFAFIFVWSTGLIEGRSIRKDIFHTIEYDYPQIVMWLVIIGLCWAPLQIYLFNRYPVQFRVLVADIIDLVWTCVVSLFTHV